MKSLFAAMLLSVALVPTAKAELDGGVKWCLKEHEHYNEAFCLGFVAGMGQAVRFYDSDICMPDAMTYGRALVIYTKYLEDNPQTQDLLGSTLFVMSMVDAFPCPTKTKGVTLEEVEDEIARRKAAGDMEDPGR